MDTARVTWYAEAINRLAMLADKWLFGTARWVYCDDRRSNRSTHRQKEGQTRSPKGEYGCLAHPAQEIYGLCRKICSSTRLHERMGLEESVAQQCGLVEQNYSKRLPFYSGATYTLGPDAG